MLVFFVVAILILTLFAVPLHLTVSAEYDFYRNEGKIKAQLFGVPIYSKKNFKATPQNVVSFTSGLINDWNKDSTMKKLLAVAMDAKIYDIGLSLEIGKSDDAYATAIAFSFFQIIVSAVLTFVKCQFNPSIESRFIPAFDETKFLLKFDGIISITIADIIHGLIAYSINKMSDRKRKRQKNMAFREREKRKKVVSSHFSLK
ncbi:MAG: hypothetical protein FWC02_00825 [Firmicutes bacterium]|nr:hypothetical protein [Bacillota bacterium]